MTITLLYVYTDTNVFSLMRRQMGYVRDGQKWMSAAKRLGAHKDRRGQWLGLPRKVFQKGDELLSGSVDTIVLRSTDRRAIRKVCKTYGFD